MRLSQLALGAWLGVVLIFSVPFLGALVLWKLPIFLCERFRQVKLLPLLGLAYHALITTIASVALALAWWQVLALAGVLFLCGGWLLPDPITFLFHPARRRAVVSAIQFVEAEGKDRANYCFTRVLGQQCGALCIAVEIIDWQKPPLHRYVAVDSQGRMREMCFEEAAAKHGIEPTA